MEPTTRTSTPPQSGRIGQQSTGRTVAVQSYGDGSFPATAFTGQVVVNSTFSSMAYLDADGVWQTILSGADAQSFFGPQAPLVAQAGDRWFNTASLIWYSWNPTYHDWMPGPAAYSDIAPTSPIVGEAWVHPTSKTVTYWNGTTWVPSTDPTAPGIYTGAMPAAATAGSAWTDDSGVVWGCDIGYTGGTGAGKWSRFAYRVDPLAALILANGGDVVAIGEVSSSPPTPDLDLSSTITGLIWYDITPGVNLGKFFVFDGTDWQQVYAPNTIDLCLALALLGATSNSASPTEVFGEDGDRLTLLDTTTQEWQLSHVPIDETLVVRWHPDDGAGVEWKNDDHYTLYDGGVVEIPDTSLASAGARAGDVFSAQYLHHGGAAIPVPFTIPYSDTDWSYLILTGDRDTNTTDHSSDDFSAWSVGQMPIGLAGSGPISPSTQHPNTTTTTEIFWVARNVGPAQTMTINVVVEDNGTIYVNGTMVLDIPEHGSGSWPEQTVDVDPALLNFDDDNIVMMKVADETPIVIAGCYVDISITGTA